MSTSLKNIILAVAGGLVVLGILGLFVEVRKAPAQPNPAKIADAAARAKGKRTAPSASTVPDDPWARSTADAAARDMKRNERDEPALEPAGREEPDEPPATSGRRVATPFVNARADGPALGRPTGSVPDVDSDPKLETSTLKEEVIRDFDKRNWEAAIDGATKALEKEPGDVRMMRVLVSSYCAMGEVDKGQAIWNELPPHDQTAMNRRCSKYGVQFKK